MIRIWREYSCPLGLNGTERFPMVLPNIGDTVRVVYSGINPSFSLPHVAAFAKAVKCPIENFEWHPDLEANELDLRLPMLQAFETEARNKYTRYFGPFEKFSRDIGVSHEHTTHLDVLGIRATSQKLLIRELNPRRAQNKIRDFVGAQRLLYTETLQELAPEIVLVANAEAARWIRTDLNLIPSEDKRYYACQAVPATKFILSAQLSGGATDEFARDRLVADAKTILKTTSNRVLRP
jgi:hypothetical protein